MPFLAALPAALAGGAASALGGAAISGLSNSGLQSAQQQAQILNPSQTAQAAQGALNTQQQQQALNQQLAAQGGIQNQSNVYGQQQQLANMLAAQSQGAGPNPALAQLNQTTGQNVANQASLMAGQRGTNANAGLLARQIAQQGAATQQQAVGQAATLRAQQQLAAESQLQQQQSNLANLATTQIGQQQAGLNNLSSQQQGLLAQANSQNQINSNLASQQAGITNRAASNAVSGIGQAVGVNLGGAQAQNQIAQPAPGLAYGGELPGKSNQYGDLSRITRYFMGGDVNMKKGGNVPGKAKVGGDSLKNDTVPAMLSPGEIVIPRSIAQHPDAAKRAAAFVGAIKAKKKK